MRLDHFNTIANIYDETIPLHIREHYLDKRVKFVRDNFTKKNVFLDLGCGTGYFIKNLNYPIRIGIDISIGMLNIAREKTKGENILFINADAKRMPLKDESIDLVVSIVMFHHLGSLGVADKVVGEISRVLKKSGSVLIWDHNPRNPYWKVLMKRLPQDTGNEKLIWDYEMKAIFQRHGLSFHRITSGFIPDFCPKTFMKIAKRIEIIMEKMPIIQKFAAHNVFIGEKTNEKLE